jgi:cytochrome c oxidase assembly protein subunit 11
MFVFAIFIMPPMYDLFCDITGLNGKTSGRYETINAKVDTSRKIKVQFLATNNASMPWKFGPTVQSITVHPGAETLINYWAKKHH